MMKKEELKLTQDWDKTFPKSDKVDHCKVTFVNRYGITLAADMYSPKEAEGKLPAIAVCGPFGAVKEQCAGLYAQTMAERGFLTIAFDPSFTGESGGNVRYMASPDINTEDFMAAVDFLSLNEKVDPERIGIIGSSAGGHLTLLAANNDGQFDTQAYSNVSSHVKCAVDLYGIADIEAVYQFNLNAIKQGKRPGRSNIPEEFPECMLLGGLPSDDPVRAKQAGGINGICEHTCPVLVMHGSDDHVVSIEQSELYYHAMNEAGKDVRYYIVDGADHGSDEFFQEETRAVIRDFLNEKL